MKLNDLINRADELIEFGKRVLGSRTSSSAYGYVSVDNSKFEGFRTAILSFLKLCYGTDHPYYEKFDSEVTTNIPQDVEKGLGIIQAARNEISGGWLISTKGLISAEIFSDFLEMGRHLLENDYKDAAAVITGSVLEEHLRQLCQKHNLDTEVEKNGKLIPKKADLLNAELAKLQIFNKLDQKNVTAWLDLRNKAAHGRYNEYNIQQVQLMHQAVSEFITRVAI